MKKRLFQWDSIRWSLKHPFGWIQLKTAETDGRLHVQKTTNPIKWLQNQASKTGRQNGDSIKGKHVHRWFTEKIEVSSIKLKDHTPSLVTLQELQLDDTYERVTVEVKVKKVTKVETVGRGKTKQDVIIADGGGDAKVILWEGHIRELWNIGYNLENFVMRE